MTRRLTARQAAKPARTTPPVPRDVESVGIGRRSASGEYTSPVPVSEAEVLRQCMDLLRVKGLCPQRQNTGATSIGRRFVRFGEPGASDITATYHLPEGSRPECRRLLVECKRPSSPGRPAGKLTWAQWSYLHRARREGAIALVVWSVDELASALEILRGDPQYTFALPPEPEQKAARRKGRHKAW